MVSTLASFITTFGVLPFVPTEAKALTTTIAIGLYAVGLYFLAPYLDKSTNNPKPIKRQLSKP